MQQTLSDLPRSHLIPLIISSHPSSHFCALLFLIYLYLTLFRELLQPLGKLLQPKGRSSGLGSFLPCRAPGSPQPLTAQSISGWCCMKVLPAKCGQDKPYSTTDALGFSCRDSLQVVFCLKWNSCFASSSPLLSFPFFPPLPKQFLLEKFLY